MCTVYTPMLLRCFSRAGGQCHIMSGLDANVPGRDTVKARNILYLIRVNSFPREACALCVVSYKQLRDGRCYSQTSSSRCSF